MKWAKAMARADRWEEDVALLNEEMRRVLHFCKWKANWWAKQVLLYKGLDAPLAEGLHTCAAKQADMEQQIHLAWSAKWVHARALAQPIIQGLFGETFVITTQDMEAGPIQFEIKEDCEDIEGDSDFEE